MEFNFDHNHECFFRGEKVFVETLEFTTGGSLYYPPIPTGNITYYFMGRDFGAKFSVTGFPLEWLECRKKQVYTVGRRD